MMTWIFEEPLYIAILGAVAAGMLGFALAQTGWRWLLYSLIGVIVVTGLLLVVEHYVETDAERIEATLYKIADRVEANDLDGTLRYVATNATAVRDQARAEFPRYHFKRVSIKRNLEVKVDRSKVPPRAVATFNVVVELTEGTMNAPYRIPRFVEVTFVEENGQWRVLSYRHWDPQMGMKLQKQLEQLRDGVEPGSIPQIPNY